MDRASLEGAAVDLAWSLWSELGVPGVVRNHMHVAVDPEPLIVASPLLFPVDPRLRDQVYGWCRTHSDRVSASRLQGLVAKVRQPARDAFSSFASTLRVHAKVRWPAEDGAEPWSIAPDVRASRLPMQRPALLRLRLRALCGVGARADVLAVLLSRPGEWNSASDLADQGYTKRNMARILSELTEAGITVSLPQRNALSFKLADPQAFSDLISANDLGLPDWSAIWRFVLESLDLAVFEPRPAAVRRVEAHKARARLRPVAEFLGLGTPPVTRANADAWEAMMAWTARQVGDLAAARSRALGVERLRAAP